ncbi:hypothetical protein MUP77_06400 [Candidatus Bathyarchaeota archaeon]|nr:hypothetical protein [Candidatus Bathyarchaeota archaeon]
MMRSKSDNGFVGGALLAVIAMYVILFQRNLGDGFLLLGIGIAIMSATSKEFRQKFFNFAFSIFTSIWRVLSDKILG